MSNVAPKLRQTESSAAERRRVSSDRVQDMSIFDTAARYAPTASVERGPAGSEGGRSASSARGALSAAASRSSISRSSPVTTKYDAR
jgi:hypothetical protein